MKGMEKDAIDVWYRSWMVREDTVAAELMRNVFRDQGYNKALRALAELLIQRRNEGFVGASQIATAYTRASMPQEAIEWLNIAYDEHSPEMPYISCDPIYDYMRGMPEFQELMNRMDYPFDRSLAERRE